MKEKHQLPTTTRSRSDVFDINPRTGALILGKNRLDDYAEKYLSEHYPPALETPMAIPVDELVEESGLRIEKACLSASSDVFACCVLVDGEVTTYEPTTGEYTQTFYPAGTIVIDPQSEWSMGEGARRNALMHEILHWEKDRTFFQIHHARLPSVDEGMEPMKSRVSTTFFEPSEKSRRKETELQWLEWQAHRLAPRVLMPKPTFTKAVTDILDSSPGVSCGALLDQLADLFQVSRSAVKYRLLEVGLKNRISKLPEYDLIYRFMGEGTEDFKAITHTDAAVLLSQNPRLRQWVQAGDYIFVEGYFVRNATRYVRIDARGDYRLKPAAKKSPKKAFLRIRSVTTKDYVGLDKDLDSLFHLEHRHGVDKRIIYIDPTHQATPDDHDNEKVYAAAAKTMSAAFEEACKLGDIISNRRASLCQVIADLLEYRGIRYPQTFTERTGLYDALFNKIQHDKLTTMKRETLMAIAVGLGLNAHATTKLMEKSGIHLNRDIFPDNVYLFMLERFPGISIHEANGILEAHGLDLLGSKSRTN